MYYFAKILVKLMCPLFFQTVFFAMQRELGDCWSLSREDTESSECKICGQVFLNAKALTDHYCGQHFFEKLAEGIPTVPPFKCPSCAFSSKTLLALVKHLGNKHKMVQKFLIEQGLEKRPVKATTAAAQVNSAASGARRYSASTMGSQDSHQFEQHYNQQHPPQPHQEQHRQIVPSQAQQQQWVEHYAQPQHQTQPQQSQQPQQPQQPQQHQPQQTPFEQQYQQDSQQHVEQSFSPSPMGQLAGVPTPGAAGGFTSPPPPPPAAASQHTLPSPHPQHEQHAQQQLLQEQQLAQQQLMTSSEVVQQHPQQDYAQQQQQQLQQPLSVNCVNNKTPEPKVTTRSDQTPVACPICTSTFLNGTHFLRHAADKHFDERLKQDLPQVAPFKCPYCSTACKDLKLLVRHYGLAHKMVLKLLNERAGIMDSFDDSILKQYETQESSRDCCPLCKSSFGGRYMLLRHLADCHFRERLCQGLPSGADVYKCPECNHESKDKGGFVRHYGLVHKMVQTWLKEMGIQGFDDTALSDQSKPSKHHQSNSKFI